MQKITKKKVLVAVGIVVLTFLFISIVKSCGKKSGTVYEYQKVSLGQVRKTISVTGTLEVLNRRRVLSKVNGVITKVFVDFNQNVRQGQVLAQLNTLDIDQQVEKIRTQLDSVRLELKLAEEELDIKRGMFKEGIASQKDMQQSEFKVKSLRFKLKQVRIDYDTVQQQRNYTHITAPLSGIVISRVAEESMPVLINTPLFELAPSLREMRLIISIDESDIGNIRRDQNVNFTVSAFPEKVFKGKISQVRINPIVKANIVTYESVVVCENDELLLKPGMTVTATVIINQRDNVNMVSNQAFNVTPPGAQPAEGKKILYVKDPNSFSKQPFRPVEVKTGLMGDTLTEIKSGVKEGDEVLIRIIKKDK